MAWSQEELERAEIEYGVDGIGDAYRVFIRSPEGHKEKFFDVPGWMVGDAKAVRLRVQAADLIRSRLIENKDQQKLKFG